MIDQINMDVVFNWRIWQIMKWVTGIVIVIALVISIYWNCTLRKELNKQRTQNEWDITAIKKIVFDTRADDKTLLQLIEEYINKREGINANQP